MRTTGHLVIYLEGDKLKYYNPIGDDLIRPNRKLLLGKEFALELISKWGWRHQSMEMLSEEESQIMLTMHS